MVGTQYGNSRGFASGVERRRVVHYKPIADLSSIDFGETVYELRTNLDGDEVFHPVTCCCRNTGYFVDDKRGEPFCFIYPEKAALFRKVEEWETITSKTEEREIESGEW